LIINTCFFAPDDDENKNKNENQVEEIEPTTYVFAGSYFSENKLPDYMAKISVNTLTKQASVDYLTDVITQRWNYYSIWENHPPTRLGFTVYYMKGEKLPNPESFLQYIVSLRNENHFHEEICEMVFLRLHETFNPSDLTISCMYTRRGGIDINPVRTLNKLQLPENLTHNNKQTKPSFRQ
jgi:hypothetical protein